MLSAGARNPGTAQGPDASARNRASCASGTEADEKGIAPLRCQDPRLVREEWKQEVSLQMSKKFFEHMLKKWGKAAKQDALRESEEWERMVNLVRALRGEK
jgi:hypothetical protein